MFKTYDHLKVKQNITILCAKNYYIKVKHVTKKPLKVKLNYLQVLSLINSINIFLLFRYSIL